MGRTNTERGLMALWKCVQIIHSFEWSTTLYAPTLFPLVAKQKSNVHISLKNRASVHCTEQNMNYIRYDKRNCLEWTKRINKSVRDRIVVCFLRSGTSTRRVMEARERYALFSMLYTATTNNSTLHDNTAPCPFGRQAHVLLFPIRSGVHH